MDKEAADALTQLLSELSFGFNDLATRVVAAERVLQRQDQTLYDEFLKEKESLTASFDAGRTALTLERLKKKLLQG